MTEEKYYSTMASFNPSMQFGEMYEKWYACFNYMLRSFKVGYRESIIKHIFHEFLMDNWHLTSEYYDVSRQVLLKEFCAEAWYIADRYSYDRIIRTHWFFLRAFKNEMDHIRYPSLYEEGN